MRPGEFFPEPDALLSLWSEGREVLSLVGEDLPVERRPSLEFRTRAPYLELEDSEGNAYRFDLTSAREQGYRWLHLSLRVDRDFTVTMDGLLGHTSTPPVEEFARGRGEALRFQPLLLPESRDSMQEMHGRGLYTRGLQTRGVATPENVSLMCLCDHCGGSFRIRSFHAPHSHTQFCYCASGTHTLLVARGDPQVPRSGESASEAQVQAFDATLPPCGRCQTPFGYQNAFRCPHCHAPYVDFIRFPREREREEYGMLLFGEEPQFAREGASPASSS